MNCSELNDGSSTETIDGELPQLLKSLLAQEPMVFQGGPVYNNSDAGW